MDIRPQRTKKEITGLVLPMQPKQNSIITEKTISPWQQGVAIFVPLLLAMGIWWLGMEAEQRKTYDLYLVPVSFAMFFVVINSVLSYNATDTGKYWTRSLMAYIAILALSLTLARLMTGVSLEDAASYKLILIVMTMAYLVFLGMISAMKKVVEIAQKQDKRWNQDR